MSIVTRFAPSPTGHLHIGGARTAIFSWAYARKNGGKFVLRVEDTDQTRSDASMTQGILDSMAWLGLDYDGEAVYQSQRFDAHNAAVDKMLETGHAYYCTCTPDEVEAMREKARAEGRKPKYDGCCREKGLGPCEGAVVRLKAPLMGTTVFEDLVKGHIAVDNAELDDMILRRSDGTPTYNLAVVVDDHDMGITHVIRGDDHVNNTPKQVLIYQALGWDVPKFAHVPMILGPDKKKLSKRHGATSVMEYQKDGYLPEALVNYLVRLGWSHGDQEIFTKDELFEVFDIVNLGTSPSVLSPEKLNWLNQHYIKESSVERLVGLLPEFLEEAGASNVDTSLLAKIIPELQARAVTLKDMAEKALFFFVDAFPIDEKPTNKLLKQDHAVIDERLNDLAEIFGDIDDFDKESLEGAFHRYMDKHSLKFKDLGAPVRLSLSGQGGGIGLFDMMELLGKDKVVTRLKGWKATLIKE